MDRRRFMTAMAGSALACAVPARVALASQAAAGLPPGPVRLVVGFPAGGGTDVLARIVANKLSAQWGMPIVVENKVGAAGLIAAAEVARAAPDGNTLMMGHINALGIAPGLNPGLKFSAERDFSAIALVGKTPQLLVTRPDSPVATLDALVARCRAKPGQVSFGSSGVGSAQHLALALFEQAAGVSALHVPYSGSAPVMNDLIGGQLDFAIEGMTTTSSFVKAGRLRAIAQTGAQRAKAFADVPTIAESGYPGYEASIWFGLVGPGNMAPALVTRINADVNRALAQPDVVAQLESFGAEDGGGSAERFADFMRDERRKWAELIKARGITLQG